MGVKIGFLGLVISKKFDLNLFCVQYYQYCF